MALHDYRRMIDIHGGGYIAVEIEGEKVAIDHYEPSTDERGDFTIDKATAGVLLDAIAGAIKQLEGLA